MTIDDFLEEFRPRWQDHVPLPNGRVRQSFLLGSRDLIPHAALVVSGGRGVSIQAGICDKRPHIASHQGVSIQRRVMPFEGTLTDADRERIRGELAAAAVERQAEMRAMGLV